MRRIGVLMAFAEGDREGGNVSGFANFDAKHHPSVSGGTRPPAASARREPDRSLTKA
jgi:hypothetical protein